MVGSAFTVALVGLGALGNAIPAPTRTLKERQVIIGGGDGSFNWGTNVPTSTCIANVPVDEQPPCIPVIVGGGINPSGKRSVNKRQTIIGDGDSSFNWGSGGAPTTPCIANVPLNEQPPCIPVIIGGGINPSGKRSLKERQTLIIGDGDSDFDWGSGNVGPCLVDVPLNEQPPCIPVIIGGGLDPGKHKRFTLPEGWNTDINKAIDELEIRLEKLQNKKHKSDHDRDEIDEIRAALKYLVGIVEISAPPGTTTVFHPGKRSELGTLGDYSDQCPDLEGAELALEHLMHKDHPSPQEYVIMRKLKSFLYGCGITIIKSPDGTTTIIKPSDKKRDLSALALPVNPTHSFDLAGLEIAFEKLVQSVGSSRPSFATWLAIQHLAATLELYGIKIEKTPEGTTTIIVPSTKRQTFTVGNQTCQLADMIGLRAALAALIAAYGPPSKAPSNIFLIEQVIVSTLNLCGQDVAGWTTITPGNPVPGGAIVPDPTHTGAPIVPDPATTGSPLNPSDKRDAPIDAAALLEALHILETQYGAYGSGTIPAPVFIIMANIVTVLQADGVVVNGWPNLGGGSIEPST